MSVAPLPHYRVLHLRNTETGARLQPDSLTIGELGRLHFTPREIRELELKKKRENKQMAFELINVATLPVREFGRRASEPRVSFSEGGQFQFNVLVQKQWEGIAKLLVQFDPEKNALAFKGYKGDEVVKTKNGPIPETAFLKVKWGKDKDGNATGLLSASGAAILTKIGYDFSTAGNQSYEAKFDVKSSLFVVEVPKTTPARKEVAPRQKKVKATPASAPKVEAPEDAELMMEVE